jgi:DNA-directed RNA polymerase specialized sigma24 family protein
MVRLHRDHLADIRAQKNIYCILSATHKIWSMNIQASEPDESAAPEGAGFLTTDEVSDAISGLTAIDKQRLRKAARLLCRFNGLSDHEGLLQETLVRAFEGIRRCRRGLPLLTFLIGAMKSIASSASKSASRSPIDPFSPPPDELENAPHREDGADIMSVPSSEQIVLGRMELAECESWFADDSEVLDLMLAMAIGLEGKELEEELHWTATLHNTVRTRMRRKIRQKLNE